MHRSLSQGAAARQPSGQQAAELSAAAAPPARAVAGGLLTLLALLQLNHFQEVYTSLPDQQAAASAAVCPYAPGWTEYLF
jgi:hypothetical protein